MAERDPDIRFGTLLPVIALAPLCAVAIVEFLDPGAHTALWYLAVLAPLVALPAAWFGRRIERSRRRSAAGGDDRAERPSRSLATPVEPAGDPAAAAALARARDASQRAARSIRTARLVRELARLNLRVHTHACAILARRPDPATSRATGGSGNPAEREERARVAQIVSDSARCYRQLRPLLGEIHSPPMDHMQPGIDPGRAIDLALELLRPRLERLGLSTDVHRPPAVPTCVGDIRSMQSVFAQLLDNAAAALSARPQPRPTGTEGPSIAVVVTVGELTVFVDITDRGVGLPAVTRERLFDPDFTTRGPGRGAGLAVCRHLLTRIGGVVELQQASRGPGARARVAIPRRDRFIDSDDPERRRASKAASARTERVTRSTRQSSRQ